MATSQAALFTSRAVRLWEVLKKDKNKKVMELKIGDVVCGRMAGHRPWPAKIISFRKNGTELHFFGTNETGCIKKSEIMPIEFCSTVIQEYLKVPTRDLCLKILNYHMLFVKATREVSGIFER